MKIHLLQLSLTNFKGIKDLTVRFSEITHISGGNATGKTTLFDAFTWLLFGKDSHDNKEFNIKTLGADGKVLPMLTHSVEGVLMVDDREVTLKRLYQEKWQRRRGSGKPELTGHETLYYWNGVPLQAGEYKSRVEELVDEQLFKLLTSPVFFNSMKWQDRRVVLTLLAGQVTPEEVLGSLTKPQVADINRILNAGKSLAEARKEIAVRRKKLTDDLATIPSRIDEVKRAIPATSDFSSLENEIEKKIKELADLEDPYRQVNALSQKAVENLHHLQSEQNTLRQTLQTLRFEAESRAREKENDRQLRIGSLRHKLAALEQQEKQEEAAFDQLVRQKNEIEEKIRDLRQQWTRVSLAEWKPAGDLLVCPACKRELDPQQRDERLKEMARAFEEDNSRLLASITAEGRRLTISLGETSEAFTALHNRLGSLRSSRQSCMDELTLLESSAAHLTPAPESIPGYAETQSRIGELESLIRNIPKTDTAKILEEKACLQAEIYELQKELGHREIIERGNQRLHQLLAEEKSLAAQICELERIEFAIEAYGRSHGALVESRVNSRFSLVRFRMFNTLVNGGIEEACECLVNGVPYPDVNTAGKIQAGLDIINTLSLQYNITAPIFIDNRETINHLPDIPTQIINLTVTTEKTLTIN